MVKVPLEVLKRAQHYRRKIPELLKDEHIIEIDEGNIVELLGFNIALNLCVARGVFDKKLSPLDIAILTNLGDMKIYNARRLLYKLRKNLGKSVTETNLRESLNYLDNFAPLTSV